MHAATAAAVHLPVGISSAPAAGGRRSASALRAADLGLELDQGAPGPRPLAARRLINLPPSSEAAPGAARAGAAAGRRRGEHKCNAADLRAAMTSLAPRGMILLVLSSLAPATASAPAAAEPQAAPPPAWLRPGYHFTRKQYEMNDP
eukprot:SAG22_NODE_289_length_12942_cov_6.674531_4_plen_147_part_00